MIRAPIRLSVLLLAAPCLAAAPAVSRPAQAKVSAARATAAKEAPSFAQGVDAIVTEVLGKTGVPSVSMAILRDGKQVYLKAHGEARLAPRAKATPAMRYSIGSISKQFTASAILLLAEQGKLSLDDKLSRFLPELPHGDQITLRQILGQVSGYPDYWPQDYVPPRMLAPVTSAEILAGWTPKLDFEPGAKWEYSNTNYVIAGRVVEKVSGEPLFSFLQKHVFGPLKMASVANVDEAALGKADSAGYRRFALGPPRPAPKEGKGWLYAMGELAMTAEDLARWDLSVMDRRLLKPASYDALERPLLLPDGESTNYGLGIGVRHVNDRKVLRHDGEVSGYTALNIVYPEQRAAVVILGNEDASDPALEEIASRVADLMFDTDTEARTAVARRVFQGLQHGRIDPAKFTANAKSYFSAQALKDFQHSLGRLGTPKSFEQTAMRHRGGFVYRGYRVKFPKKTLKIIAYEQPDGTYEQYMVVPD